MHFLWEAPGQPHSGTGSPPNNNKNKTLNNDFLSFFDDVIGNLHSKKWWTLKSPRRNQRLGSNLNVFACSGFYLCTYIIAMSIAVHWSRMKIWKPAAHLHVKECEASFEAFFLDFERRPTNNYYARETNMRSWVGPNPSIRRENQHLQLQNCFPHQ